VFRLVVYTHALWLCVLFTRAAGWLRFVLAGFCCASDSLTSGELLDAHARAMFGGAVEVHSYFLHPIKSHKPIVCGSHLCVNFTLGKLNPFKLLQTVSMLKSSSNALSGIFASFAL
jgi:hypothetical protein